MKKIRILNRFLLAILIAGGSYISLGALSYGSYGRSQIGFWGLVGQKQKEDKWCLYACIAIMTNFRHSQCDLATEHFITMFGGNAYISCCNKPAKTDSGYYMWETHCLLGPRWKNIPYFVSQYLNLQNMSETIDQRIYKGSFANQEIYPCLGLNYSEGHAIVISGGFMSQSNTVGQSNPLIGIHYYDPWYDHSTTMYITPLYSPSIYCLIPF